MSRPIQLDYQSMEDVKLEKAEIRERRLSKLEILPVILAVTGMAMGLGFMLYGKFGPQPPAYNPATTQPTTQVYSQQR